MPLSDNWWSLQLIENMKESYNLYQRFKEASEPDIQDLDESKSIYEDCCYAYKLAAISFEEFIEIGSLLAAQAHK